MFVGDDLVQIIGLAYHARKPVLLEGPTGVGKSALAIQCAIHLGIDVRVVDLSLLEPSDLTGLPFIENGLTRYALPASLPGDGVGLLVLEELNRAERYMRQPALQLLTARRLNAYVLPDGWAVVATINPDDGAYQVDALDPALRDRFLVLRVSAQRRSWLEWAQQHGVHPAVLQVAETHDGLFEEVSPRRWTDASDVLKEFEARSHTDESILRMLLRGYLPATWVEVLLNVREQQAPAGLLGARAALAGYDQDEALRDGVLQAKLNGQTDVLARLARDATAILEAPNLSALIDRGSLTLKAFERLLDDLPGDHAVRLQEVFGSRPETASLLDVAPTEVLESYPRSAAKSRVDRWLSDPASHHRAWALASALGRYLERHPAIFELRRKRRAQAGLGLFLSQLNHPADLRLAKLLKRLDIKPIEPGSRGS